MFNTPILQKKSSSCLRGHAVMKIRVELLYQIVRGLWLGIICFEMMTILNPGEPVKKILLSRGGAIFIIRCKIIG
jgi:hypothetical protein